MATKKSTKKQTTKAAAEKRPAKRKKIVSLAEYEAEAQAIAPTADVGPTAKNAVKATTEPTIATSGDVGEPAIVPSATKNGGKMSCLDAAAKVLAEAGEPLGCGEMFNRMHAAGYWTSDKATPQNTIYAAILTEIKKKADASRFRKAARGKFELNR